MDDSPSDWELSKENIQPLKHGRKISSLRSALCPRNDEKQLQKQAFEDELRTYSGEDPLEVWYSYILWVEQNYPKGGKEGNIGPLVERCIITFAEKAEYKNDIRFVEVWIKYANMHSDALEIYDYMYTNNIGCELSIFYENWAWLLENIENFKRADAVLCEGIQRKAQPLETLLMAQRHLELRIGNRLKRMVNTDTDELQFEEPRGVLSSLKPYGKKNIVTVNRVGPNKIDISVDPQKSEKIELKNSTRKLPFKIHNDENAYTLSLPSQSNASAKVIPYVERTKENELKPRKWSNAKIPLKPTVSNSKQAFEIYEDKECTQTISTKTNWHVPIALFEPYDPTKIPMYDKNKVYAGGEEFCFEEIRAARWFKEQKGKTKREKERQAYNALQNEVRELREQLSSLQNQICGSNVSSMSDIKTALQKLTIPKDAGSSKSNDKIYDQCHENVQSENKAVIIKSSGNAANDTEIVSQPLYLPSEYNHTEEYNNDAALNNNSSLVACHISVVESQHSSLTGSPHMKEAMSMLRGVWYQSGFDDIHATEDLTKIKEINMQEKKFTIYQDTSTIHQLSVALEKPAGIEIVGSSGRCSDNESFDADAQNKLPEGYIQEQISRPISGILCPSIGIPVESQIQVNEDYENDAAIGNLDNITVSAEKFVPNSQLVSTPFHDAHNSDDQTATSVNVSISEQPDIEKHLLPSTYKSSLENCGTSLRVGGELSVITEGSCEYYSKSSSSSSAMTHLELSTNMQQSSSTSEIIAKHSTVQKPFDDDIRKYENVSSRLDVEQHISVVPTDIDPFDIHVTQNILSKLSNPVSERCNYYKVNEAMPVLRVPRMHQLGKEKYVVLRRHTQGGYAKIYVAQHNAKGVQKCLFALKVSKPMNEWEFYICSEIWERLNGLNTVPDVRESIMFIENAVFYKDGVILINKFGSYGTLIDIGNLYKKCNQTMPECLVMCFTLEMLHIVQQVHRCKIIHADIKPDNFLVINLDTFTESHVGNGNKSGVLKLIDFGRSVDMKQFPPGTAFMTVVNTSAFKCTEMLEGKPWTFQTDWFGVIGTIHTLLFGEYMKVYKNKEGYWEISNKFKRYWQVSFWQKLFHILLNIPGCDRIPDLSSFITELTVKLQEPCMAIEIKRKALLLYELWSANT